MAQNLLWQETFFFQHRPVSDGSRETDLLKAAVELNETIKRTFKYKHLFPTLINTFIFPVAHKCYKWGFYRL